MTTPSFLSWQNHFKLTIHANCRTSLSFRTLTVELVIPVKVVLFNYRVVFPHKHLTLCYVWRQVWYDMKNWDHFWKMCDIYSNGIQDVLNIWKKKKYIYTVTLATIIIAIFIAKWRLWVSMNYISHVSLQIMSEIHIKQVQKQWGLQLARNGFSKKHLRISNSVCNCLLKKLDSTRVAAFVLPKAQLYFVVFVFIAFCYSCGKIYTFFPVTPGWEKRVMVSTGQKTLKILMRI